MASIIYRVLQLGSKQPVCQPVYSKLLQPCLPSVVQPCMNFFCSPGLCEEKSVEVSVKESSRDRTKVVPVETSIRYLQSSAYATTYGDQPIWKQYRRNHKGAIAPRRTRKTCVRKGQLTTGNPCPICRDEYLVIHPDNIELLKQFICPHTGQILTYTKTGVCQKKFEALVIAIELAKDKGLITFDVPFRQYDYSLYQSGTQ